eukprot:TRINITY_DN10979_c0_g2_i1.p1 TRINITY_DN10979_c0_g2~~TRINITY_DN10979_c0_g2_i1.p1  ORF type:complete len:590 (-),score=129.54 TRINITY_DN10979_c0_g2_i1:234-2003(-)
MSGWFRRRFKQLWNRDANDTPQKEQQLLSSECDETPVKHRRSGVESGMAMDVEPDKQSILAEEGQDVSGEQLSEDEEQEEDDPKRKASRTTCDQTSRRRVRRRIFADIEDIKEEKCDVDLYPNGASRAELGATEIELVEATETTIQDSVGKNDELVDQISRHMVVTETDAQGAKDDGPLKGATDDSQSQLGDALAQAAQPRLLLVVGECGDGKSTLINAFRDPERSGPADSGLKSRGVTKTITAYVGKPIGEQPVDLLDTPGVGDKDVTPMKVLSMIEQELISKELGGADAIDAVIVTTPVPDGRVKLGAQVVQMLVENGFVGEDKWKNVILVGTKADRATPEELEFFKSEIAAEFFAHAPGKTGTFVTTSMEDYSQLSQAIASLPLLKVHYSTPEPSKMAEAFAQTLGLSKEALTKELVASREALQKEFARQFEEQEQRLNRERAQMQAKLDEQERQAKLEAERLRAAMDERLSASQRKLAELQKAAPEEREILESQLKRLQHDLRLSKHEHEAAQLRLEEKLADRDRRLAEMEQKIQEQNAMRARNYNFGMSVPSLLAPRCQHPRRRKWANGHGRGSKCIDCRVELG